MAVSCHNASKNTHKTTKNFKIHTLVTKYYKENLKNVYWLLKNEL